MSVSDNPAGDLVVVQAGVMDHSSEFVDLVQREAPGAYRELLDSGRFASPLAENQGFNHGKLFVYAEYCVFRREFNERFPDASPAACVNAFAGLLLKNDISITNLVDFIEGAPDRERRALERHTPG